MTKRNLIRLSLVLVIAVLGVWALSSSAGIGAESVARQQAMRAALAPAGVSADGAAGAPTAMEPITAVSANMADVAANSGPIDSMYDKWLRGEIDLDEADEGRLSAAERQALIEASLSLPPNESVQDADSAVGAAPDPAGVAFDSIDASECCGGSGTNVPPDPDMAAGPDNLIAVVNVVFEIYDKSGTSLVGPATLASFFSALGGGCASDPFDPTALYDEEADRFAIAADGDGTHFCIGVSKTADPTGDWWLYAVPAQPFGGEFHDYPHTGVGDEYIVVGANQFGGGVPGGFEGRVWALDKADMYSGSALTPFTASTTDLYGSPQPLTLHGYNQGTWPAMGSTNYFVTDVYDGCTIQVWKWDVPAAPAIASTIDLCVATGVAGGFPLPAPQLGGGTLEGNDWRNRGFEYRNGSGWVTDMIACAPAAGGGSVDCVRWEEIDLTAAVPTLVQAGVMGSTDEYRTFPDLAVNACDDMAVGYTKTSSSTYAGIWYTGREAGDPAGTLQAEAELKAGEVTYVAFDGAPYRWGDYTGMTIDPDGTTFWYLGEYSKDITGPAANWGNYIGSFEYPDCDPAGGDPNIYVDPLSMSSTQNTNTVVMQTLTISNTGTADLDWLIEEDNASPLGGPWSDDFDSYATGQDLHGVGGWKGWFNDPTYTAFTSDVEALSAPNSVDIVGDADLVHEYSVSSGQWIYTAWQYVPSAFSGDSFFIMLNQYDDAGITNNWSVQVHFDSVSNTVISDNEGVTLPLITGQWVELRVEIDLDADTQTFYYDNTELYTKSWAEGVSGGGITSIAAVDLFANAASSVYYDDMSLVEVGGGGPCDAPDDIPWLTVSPGAGTNAGGTATDVDLTYDSTGLAAGTYNGDLCISSNDPDMGPGNETELVIVPVELIVEQPTDVSLSGIGGDASASASAMTMVLALALAGVIGFGLVRRRSVSR